LAGIVARRGRGGAAIVRGMSFGGSSSVASGMFGSIGDAATLFVLMRLGVMECNALDAGARRPFEYGRTHVVRPKGTHKATIVWLHGLGDNGARYGNALVTNVKL